MTSTAVGWSVLGWADARDSAAPVLWLRDLTNQYRFEYLADQKVLYCQINTIQQKSDDSLRTFMARAIATADSAGAERFVLDLRLNGGGNGFYNGEILLPLIKSRYDVPGRLYVITGRRTFSAAQMLVTELMKYTTAVFVGEPTSHCRAAVLCRLCGGARSRVGGRLPRWPIPEVSVAFLPSEVMSCVFPRPS